MSPAQVDFWRRDKASTDVVRRLPRLGLCLYCFVPKKRERMNIEGATKTFSCPKCGRVLGVQK